MAEKGRRNGYPIFCSKVTPIGDTFLKLFLMLTTHARLTEQIIAIDVCILCHISIVCMYV